MTPDRWTTSIILGLLLVVLISAEIVKVIRTKHPQSEGEPWNE